jgi:hypothetical protein
MPVKRPAIPAAADMDLRSEEVAARLEHDGVQVEYGALQHVPDLSRALGLPSGRRHWSQMLRHGRGTPNNAQAHIMATGAGETDAPAGAMLG